MILAIDIGNTNCRFALFSDEKMGKMVSIKTSDISSPEKLSTIMDNFRVKLSGAVISSVLKEIPAPLISLIEERYGIEPLIISDDIKLNINIDYDRPEQLGADRIANAVAGGVKYPGENLIIADLGTALTFDILLADSTFAGGVIAPGFNLAIKAIHQQTSRLPEINFQKPEKISGTSTIQCLQSGFYYGWLSLTEGIIRKIKKEYNLNFRTIITGGCGELLSEGIDHAIIEPMLTMEGIYHCWKLNN